MGVLVAAIVLLALLAALTRGFVRAGRAGTVGDYPACARCFYDLSGVGPVAACPECGNGLQNPEDTRRGRPVRDMQATFGLAILATILLAVAWTALRHGSSVQDLFDLRARFLSLSTLASECGQDDRGRAAVGELERRWRGIQSRLGDPVQPAEVPLPPENRAPLPPGLEEEFVPFAEAIASRRSSLGTRGPDEEVAGVLESRRLSEESRDRIFGAVISSQQTAAGRAGYAALSQLFKREAARGRIAPTLVQAHLQANLRPEAAWSNPKPSISEAVELVVSLGPLTEHCIGSRLTCSMKPVGVAAGWTMSGPHLNPAVLRHMSAMDWSYRLQPTEEQLRCWVITPAAPGEYQVDVDLEFRLFDFRERGSAWTDVVNYADPAALGPLDQPKLSFTIRTSTTLTVLPAPDSPETTLTSDPRPALVASGKGPWHGVRVWQSPLGRDVHVSLRFSPPPVTVSAEVFAVQGGVEHDLGWILVPAGSRWDAAVSKRDVGLAPGDVQIVLRPAPQRVYRVSGLGPVYNRPITLDARLWSPPLSAWNDPDNYASHD